MAELKELYQLPDRKHYSTSEVCVAMGLGYQTFLKHIFSLGIERIRIGHSLMITKSDFNRLIDKVSTKFRIILGRPKPGGSSAYAETSGPTHVIKSKLTIKQLEMASWVGVQRQIDRIGKGQHDQNWQSHIEGALAEFAVAQYLGRHWDGAIGTPGSGDIGRKIEVRSTSYPDGRLLIKERDATNSDWVLVVGSNGDYDIVGWIEGIQGKVKKYWGALKPNAQGMYIIPRSELKPMSWLKREQ